MTFLKATQATLCMALLGAAFSPSARADEVNRKTVITFSGPVEIPGVHLQGFGILPAGTYVFKVLDSQSNRDIVQILSKDELTVYATILAIPNYRLKATDKTVMTFRERPAGELEALRAWFYPGRQSGEEFVYGKARALILAKETHTAVLFFTPAEIAPEVAVAIKTPAEPVVVELEKAPVMAVQPTGGESAAKRDTYATMVQLENIEAIEARLWRAADLLRSGSELASNEYFMPVMGLIFLRHAYSRFLAVKPRIEASLPSRGGVTRQLKKEDFSTKGSIFLQPEAQFDYFIQHASDPTLPQLIIKAMESGEDGCRVEASCSGCAVNQKLVPRR